MSLRKLDTNRKLNSSVMSDMGHSIKLDTYNLARIKMTLLVSLRFKKTVTIDTTFDCDFLIVHYWFLSYLILLQNSSFTLFYWFIEQFQSC